MDVFVKNRVWWPHEHVLSGSTKERVTYDQLTVTQWVCGFCRTPGEENNETMRSCMLDYIISLMDDANDFSWGVAKASHVVLLCRMEQGEIQDHSQTEKIYIVRRANAQRHMPTGSENIRILIEKMVKSIRNPWFALISTKTLAISTKLMKPKVSFTDIFVLHALVLVNHFHIRMLIVGRN